MQIRHDPQATVSQRRAPQHRYAAFISYSRAVDGRLAPALQDALQRFAKPWYRRWALRVFRDDASLSASPGLWPAIASALDSSEFFILLASPEAARSKWVTREIEHWLDKRDASKVLIAVTDGEVGWNDTRGDFDRATSDCLPEALYGRLPHEPRWIDLRSVRRVEHLSLQLPDFRDRIADLAAPLHHVSKDELFGEHVRRHRSTWRLVQAAIASLSVLTLLAATATVAAVKQREAAEAERRTAVVRQLIALSDAARARGDIPTAARFGLAATTVGSDRATQANLTRLLMGSRIVATLTGYAEDVRSVSFSPDGRMLASASYNGAVHLWDTSDRFKPSRIGSPLIGQHGSAAIAVFSPDSRTLASADGDQVVLSDVSDRSRPIRLSTTRLRAVASLAFSPDGRTLAVGAYTDMAFLDVADRSRPTLLNMGPIRAIGAAASIVLSVGGRTMATMNSDGVILWDITVRHKPTRLAEIIRGRIPPTTSSGFEATSIAISPDGRTLAAAGQDGTVLVFDVTDPARPARINQPLTGHTGPATSVAFSADGRILASGGGDQSVLLWDLADRAQPKLLDRLQGHRNTVTSVAFSPDGTLASASDDHTVLLWNPVHSASLPARLGGLDGDAATFSPDGNLMASALDDDAMLWEVIDPTRPAPEGSPLTGHTNDVTSVAFSPDGRTLASASHDMTILLWDVSNASSPARLGRLTGHSGPVASVAFSPLGGLMASASYDQTVILWNVSDRTHPIQLSRTESVGGTANSLTFAPDGRTMASTGWTTAVLWDVSNPARPTQPAQLTSNVQSLAFSADGRILATGGRDRSVRLWGIRNQAKPIPLAELSGHTDTVEAIAFSPDGDTMASASRDQSVILWDIVDSSQPIQLGRLTGHTAPITALAFAPDGRTLASSEIWQEKTVLWDLRPLKELRHQLTGRACAVAGQSLDPTEWAFYIPGEPYRNICA